MSRGDDDIFKRMFASFVERKLRPGQANPHGESAPSNNRASGHLGRNSGRASVDGPGPPYSGSASSHGASLRRTSSSHPRAPPQQPSGDYVPQPILHSRRGSGKLSSQHSNQPHQGQAPSTRPGSQRGQQPSGAPGCNGILPSISSGRGSHSSAHGGSKKSLHQVLPSQGVSGFSGVVAPGSSGAPTAGAGAVSNGYGPSGGHGYGHGQHGYGAGMMNQPVPALGHGPRNALPNPRDSFRGAHVPGQVTAAGSGPAAPGGGSIASDDTSSARPPRKRTRMANSLQRSRSAHATTMPHGIQWQPPPLPPSAMQSGSMNMAGGLARPVDGRPSGSLQPGSSGSAPQRSFPCGECGSVFTQRGQLSRHHRRVHEKLRPHACEYCGRLFGARSDRTRHVQIVHKKEPR